MKVHIYKFFQRFFRLFPMKEKKILFMSYYGNQYGCNPKYLSEHFSHSHGDWSIVWAFADVNRHEHVNGIKVRYLSLRFFYELCTARVFVTNYRMPIWYEKRKGQLYVQTWHSSLRLKRIENDSVASLPAHYVDMAKHDSQQISLLLSGGTFSTSIFQRAFWYDGKILEAGTPRCDLLFESDSQRRHAILDKLGIKRDTYVLLYAPTFRKDNNLDCYDVDYASLSETLTMKYGGHWKIAVRLHPHLLHYSAQLVGSNSEVLDVTAFDDIQQLLYVADAVISDYSGLIFDYMLTGRPCFLYTPDLQAYLETDRDLYFDITALPFPVCQSNAELKETILSFDAKDYRHKIDTFMAVTGSKEDGHACERIANYIVNLQKL